ncbi:MAG: Ig-like domain-containing protein, partial [Firmicutes bacterium]|nr:Ig-like domain-containing protein [Bacillota bacterium]
RNVMKKNSIISIIIILLILLTAILFVRGCSQEGSEMKNYNVAGTYTETSTYQNAEISVSGVNIENATYTGNVSITDAVVDGDIRLTNSAVQGELLVKGGGTIYLDGGSYQNITLEKQDVKLVLLGEVAVENLTIRSAATVVVDNQSKVKNLNVEKTASRTSITTQANGTIENIQSRGISDIVLNTPAKLVGFGPNAGGSTLVTNAIVDKIVAESKIVLTLNANVGSLLLTSTGEGTSITLGNNAVIASLGTETRVEIKGEGSVTSATTNDILNITGTITPDVVYLTTKPVVTDPNGGMTISTNTSRTANSTGSSSSSSSWFSEDSSSGTIINSKYDAPPLNPVDPTPTPTPTPPSPPANIAVTGIQVTPVEADVIMGNTLKLNAVVFPENASNQTVLWESSNPSVATVTNGVVTPVSNGEVTITARTQDGDKTDTSKVTVKTNISAVTMINTINAVNNSIAETVAYDSSYSLPVVVIVQGFSSEIFPCTVNWSPNTVDPKKVGETTYTGTLVMPAGYVNLNNIQPSIVLTVQAQPVITASSALSSQRIYLNDDPAPVFVEASVTEDKVLTYQWSQRIGDVETPLPEVTGPIYDPPVSTTPGTVYYNCIITSENAVPVTVLAGIVVTSAEPVDPNVTPDETASVAPVVATGLSEKPTITSQPTSISQLTGVALAASLAQATNTAQAALGSPKTESIPAAFSVEASITDGGTLTYQWFESKSLINADGTAIAGATNKTLDVDASGPAGTTYYYVEITNTKEGCLPETTVSLPVLFTVV